MVTQTADGVVPAPRGFTLVELLVAMALLALTMSIASERFVAGLETVRQLKGIGDLNDRLREDADTFRQDVLATNRWAEEFIAGGLRSGSADPAEASALKAEYEAICADAVDLDTKLQAVERQTVNPVARRLLQRSLKELDIVKEGAAQMVWLLELIAPSGPGT